MQSQPFQNVRTNSINLSNLSHGPFTSPSWTPQGSDQQTFLNGAQTALSVTSKDLCLFLKAQFQTYAGFSNLLHTMPHKCHKTA